jgi:hypothetical protein
MVRAELREAGIEALGMEGTSDLVDALASGLTPSAVVLDGVALESPAARQALENLPRNIAILVVDSRIMPVPSLPSAEVLRRPVQVREIVSWVLKKLSREAA